MLDRRGKKKTHCTSLHTVPQNTFRVNEVQTEPDHRSSSLISLKYKEICSGKPQARLLNCTIIECGPISSDYFCNVFQDSEFLTESLKTLRGLDKVQVTLKTTAFASYLNTRKQHVSKPIQLEIMLGFYQDDKNKYLSIFGYIIIG